MALAKCPDCGRKVSTEAAACPHCGRPIEQLEITFPDKHKYVFDREVIEFSAVVDGKTVVPCRITLEEMSREFGCGKPGTFEDDFRRLRPQIEERAKQEIQSKLTDDE